MANRVNRVKKLEEQLGVDDYGLRVIVPMGCFYGENVKPYWTDEPVKNGLDDFYQGKTYRKVEHPDGKKAVSGVFS